MLNLRWERGNGFLCRGGMGLALVAVSLFVLTGCGSDATVAADRISKDPYASGDGQCGGYGQELAKPLRVVVQGAQQRGYLGGKGSRPSVAGQEVVFTVENPGSGAVFVESGEARHVTKTGTDGSATARVRLGAGTGDVSVVATTTIGEAEKSARFRATTGVKLVGKSLEASLGGKIEELGVELQDPSGKPAVGVAVHFRVAGESHKAKVGKQRVLTGADGRAVTSFTLGDKVGRYFVSVEIQDERAGVPEDAQFNVRPFELKVMGSSAKKMVVVLFGGLAVFIFGMKLMSEGLQRMADRRLKAILQAMTRNRFMATGVGAMLTAMVQSSSATTVMVVGFVNAGLIGLGQAIGVIYGANVGTTITAQIIAFKLNVLAYPAIAFGLVLAGVARKSQHKALGETILGFGLLFLGMSTMSDILKPLRYSPGFQDLFQMFECMPVDGFIPAQAALMAIVIGAVATCIVQSSSASTGLILALASQGLISFYTAVPLILGTNIGTTITAMLASVGTNRNAKRAALAHTLFNVIGALYMYVLLFMPWWKGEPLFLGLINEITPGNVFAETPENLARHVANAHTVFNVANCLMFLPFIGLMTKVCHKIIPLTDVDQEKILAFLEPHLLQSPTLALQQATKEVAYMVHRSQKSINEACEYFLGGPSDLVGSVERREDVIDRLQKEITEYLVELSRKELMPSEAMLIPALIHAVNDAERIGDHSEDLVQLTQQSREHKLGFSEKAKGDIVRLQEMLGAQFEATHEVLMGGAEVGVTQILAREEDVNNFAREASDGHVDRLGADKCDVQSGVVFLDFLSHLERVGDHLTNIAERAGRITEVMGAVTSPQPE